jgi:hypothetical protein
MHVIGKCVTVSQAERRRPPCVHAALPKLVHDMTHRQVFVNVLAGIPGASGIQRLAAVGNHLGGEWDVRRDDEVARLDALVDDVISHVEPGWHLEHLNMGRRGDVERLIRDQCQRDPPLVGGPIQQVFDDLGTPIGIDPDVHHEAPHQIANEWDRPPGLHAVRADGG